jgi:hypothetical protein
LQVALQVLLLRARRAALVLRGTSALPFEVIGGQRRLGSFLAVLNVEKLVQGLVINLVK